MAKRTKTIYWISTAWLALGMLSTGTLQLFKAKAEGTLAPSGSATKIVNRPNCLIPFMF
jgi:hypothetical protein